MYGGCKIVLDGGLDKGEAHPSSETVWDAARSMFGIGDQLRGMLLR
jgi:hypothetical protein